MLPGLKGGGVCVCSACAWPWSHDHRPAHPYYAGTEHVGFSPTRGGGVGLTICSYQMPDMCDCIESTEMVE